MDDQTTRFAFRFDDRFAGLVRLTTGATPENSEVAVTDTDLRVRFGRLRCRTPLANIKGIQITRDYRWYTAIGARGSFADRGATFGSSTVGGVCTCFHEPVGALFGSKRRIHPGLTMTVTDLEGLAGLLAERTGIEVVDHPA